MPAHAVDDLARAFVVRADVRENRADLIEIRRGVLQEELGRLGVAQDRRERLIDLMRQSRRELAHHRDAPRVRDLSAGAAVSPAPHACEQLRRVRRRGSRTGCALAS